MKSSSRKGLGTRYQHRSSEEVKNEVSVPFQVVAEGDVASLDVSEVRDVVEKMLMPVCKFKIDHVNRGQEGRIVLNLYFPSQNQAKKAERVLKLFNKDERALELFTKNKNVVYSLKRLSLISNEEKPSKEHIESFVQNQKELLAFFAEHKTEATESHQQKEEEIKSRLQDTDDKLKDANEPEFNKNTLHLLQAKKNTLEQKLRDMQDQKCEFQSEISCLSEKVRSIAYCKDFAEKLWDLKLCFWHEITCFSKCLPTYAKRSEVLFTLKIHPVCVVVGETGSGKSTQLIQYICRSNLFPTGIIACTQPRKIAAASLARHVAQEMGCSVGALVGYKCGLQSRTSSETRMLFATDQVLLNEYYEDPMLAKYSCIILDEAHERSLNTDILMGMIKKCLQKRTDLRIMITSATIDPKVYVEYFKEVESCPVIEIPGNMFPVEVSWSEYKLDLKTDYVKRAVDTVQEIIKNEELGDVLVFLATPAETERAAKLLGGAGGKIVVGKLHGRLSVREQFEVFKPTPPGKRKVVFCTNAAETSVTIPGIRYVVDSGIVKRKKLDAEGNVCYLALDCVSQSSAKQRKGRAGRTMPGKCFRLYSKECFDSFEPSDVPQILRVNLGKTFLDMVRFGLDPLDFDYITAPCKSSLLDAREELRYLGALDSSGVTNLGSRMALFSVEPRLSKLILLGIFSDVPPETVVLAAVIGSGSDIIRSRWTQENSTTLDQKRLLLYSEEGDFITWLIIFCKWFEIEESKKKEWCFEKGLSWQALKDSRALLKEIEDVLMRNLNIQIHHSFRQDYGPILPYLRKLLLFCFGRNLCMFSQSSEVGTTLSDTPAYVEMQRTSSLYCLGHIPFKYAIYQYRLLATTDLIANVTPVEEEWVMDEIRRSKRKWDLKSMDEFEIKRKTLKSFGDVILKKYLIGTGGEKLKNTTSQLRAKYQCFLRINCNVDDGNITVDIRDSDWSAVKGALESILLAGKEELLKDERTFPVYEDFYTGDSGSIIIGSGFQVKEIRLPGEYTEVILKTTEKSPPVKSVIESLRLPNGAPKPTVLERKETLLVFANPTMANYVVQNNKVPNCYLEPQISQRHTNDRKDAKLSCKWMRRGITGGEVFFKTPSDAFLALITLAGGLKRIDDTGSEQMIAQFDVKNTPKPCLQIKNIMQGCTQEEFEKCLRCQVPGFKIDNIRYNRVRPFKTTEKEYEDVVRGLQETVKVNTGYKCEYVQVMRPRESASQWQAYLGLTNPAEAEDVLTKLNGKVFAFTKQCPLILKPVLTKKVQVPASNKHAYEVLRGSLVLIIDEINAKYGCDGNIKVAQLEEPDVKFKGGISLKTRTLKEMWECQCLIYPLLEGQLVAVDTDDVFAALSMRSAYQHLQQLAKTTSTHINVEFGFGIRIYGGQKEVSAASAEVNRLVEMLQENEYLHTIQLKKFGTPGLLKALIHKYGIDLEGMNDALEEDLIIFVDVRNQELTFTSSEKTFEKVLELVKECVRTILGDKTPFTVQTYSEICPCCEMEIQPSRKTYRLQFCGHLYCRKCIQGLIKEMELPLSCKHKECSSPLVIEDIQGLIFEKDRVWQELLKKAVDLYIARTENHLKRCPTPSCPAILRVSSQSEELFVCPMCANSLHGSC